jgi:hypothetical protein
VDNNYRAELDQLWRDCRFLSANHGANSKMSLLSDYRQKRLDEFLRGWGSVIYYEWKSAKDESNEVNTGTLCVSDYHFPQGRVSVEE